MAREPSLLSAQRFIILILILMMMMMVMMMMVMMVMMLVTILIRTPCRHPQAYESNNEKNILSASNFISDPAITPSPVS